MLSVVEVRNSQGAVLALPLDDVSSGIFIQEIEGLDPVKATLISSSFATMDGAQYQSSSRETRNIKLTLGLEPDYSVDSVQDLRQRLYGFFMPKALVLLSFYLSDGLQVNIEGRVESLESVLFTKDPTVTVSLMCFDPDFYDPTTVLVQGQSTVSDFDEILIDYVGTVETGIELVITANRTVPSFTLYNRSPDNISQAFDFVAPLDNGDVLTINTVAGEKGVIREASSGFNTSLAYGVSPASYWITLFPGENYIRVYTPGTPQAWALLYTTRYGGL